MKKLKTILKKLIYKQFADSESFVTYLRKKGCLIGNNTVFYAPKTTIIDVTRPFMISIGDDVKITNGVIMLTHGYDWSVIRHKYGSMLGSCGKISIGNNVFIGANTTILKGVSIGNNVIIGANTLVNKDIPDNCVIGGNPVRIIMSLEDYYLKRKKEYILEAKELALSYYNRYNKIPPIESFHEFYPLFLERDLEIAKKYGFNFLLDGVYCKDLELDFLNTKPMFNGYREFIKWCGIK